MIHTQGNEVPSETRDQSITNNSYSYVSIGLRVCMRVYVNARTCIDSHIFTIFSFIVLEVNYYVNLKSLSQKS